MSSVKAKPKSPKTESRKGRPATPTEIVMAPELQAVSGMQHWATNFAGNMDLSNTAAELNYQISKIKAGDLGSIEARLYAQSVTLETMFTHLTRRANGQNLMEQFKACVSLALKAQAQCRATLETLAEIKQPRHIAFVAQANIARQQQVNNAHHPPPTRTEESQIEPNGLLEELHNERVDFGATGTAGRDDQDVETLAALHRATNG